MSYEMRWKLRVQPEDAPELVALEWAQHDTAPGMRRLRGLTGEIWSWYAAEAEMLALSRRFPKLLFILFVDNVEEPGLYPPEVWYFRDGHLYKDTAQIVFPDFDPAKLVPCKPS